MDGTREADTYDASSKGGIRETRGARGSAFGGSALVEIYQMLLQGEQRIDVRAYDGIELSRDDGAVVVM